LGYRRMNTSYLRAGLWFVCLSLAACNGRTTIEEPKTQSSTPAPEPLRGMDEAQTAHLWDIEHHGNILNQIAFPALAGALKQGDAKALRDILAPGFTGAVPREPKEVAIHNEFVDVVRLADAGKPPDKLDEAQFVERLLEFRRFFKHSVMGGKIAL